MGCTCECHDKLNKVGVLGCCFKCEAEHDPLRNALGHIEEMLKGGAHVGPCTNDDDPHDSCETHVATSKARDADAKAFLDKMRGGKIPPDPIPGVV